MVPIEKVKDIIIQHDKIEKELSSGSIDPKLFAKMSKEYSRLGRIISVARKYVNFDPKGVSSRRNYPTTQNQDLMQKRKSQDDNLTV